MIEEAFRAISKPHLSKLQSLSIVAGLLTATAALVFSLVCTGYSIAHGAFNFKDISGLGVADLTRLTALDSIVWAPGLYAICWICATRTEALANNIPLLWTLVGLLGMDCIDDFKAANKIDYATGILAAVDLAINAGLLFSFWSLVRNWPKRLTVDDLRAEQYFPGNFPFLRRFPEWHFKTRALPISLFIISNAAKISKAAFGIDFGDAGESIELGGMSFIILNLVYTARINFISGDWKCRDRLIWLLMAIVSFGIYTGMSGILDGIKDLGSISQIYNTTTLMLDWFYYAMTLLILLFGAINHRFISLEPMANSRVFQIIFFFTIEVSLAVLIETIEKTATSIGESVKQNAIILHVSSILLSIVITRLVNLMVKRVNAE